MTDNTNLSGLNQRASIDALIPALDLAFSALLRALEDRNPGIADASKKRLEEMLTLLAKPQPGGEGLRAAIAENARGMLTL